MTTEPNLDNFMTANYSILKDSVNAIEIFSPWDNRDEAGKGFKKNHVFKKKGSLFIKQPKVKPSVTMLIVCL